MKELNSLRVAIQLKKDGCYSLVPREREKSRNKSQPISFRGFAMCFPPFVRQATRIDEEGMVVHKSLGGLKGRKGMHISKTAFGNIIQNNVYLFSKLYFGPKCLVATSPRSLFSRREARIFFNENKIGVSTLEIPYAKVMDTFEGYFTMLSDADFALSHYFSNS